MALSDIITNPRSELVKGPPCAVCEALAHLSEADAAALRTLLGNPSWRYQELSDALAADEDTPLSISANTLSRHARGHCAAREKLR